MHGFEVERNFVFKDDHGKCEIDLVAKRFDLVICIDTKFYSAKRYRVSQLKKEAEKHFKRCKRFEKIIKKKCIPVLVPFIDDKIYFHGGCLIVPFNSFNEFLFNVHYYLMSFQLL